MNELIMEVEEIIRVQQYLIKRNELSHEFLYTSEYDHFIQLAHLYKTLEVWEDCHKLMLKYLKKREVPIGSYSGSVIEQMFKVNRHEGISIKTQEKIVEYIKTLEWQLEGALYNKNEVKQIL
ncbi:MAG: hypothetical protein KME52_28550 [Desmonostoc geniculatum HA4340-LM1]|jgi:hypothetical protein|nr:hypothetical protein [Desmonostoc geniculatum HA4340-LM1]